MTDALTSTFFEIERHGAVVELRMNRPDKANGMSPDFWEDLPRLVGEIDADMSARALVLTGAGRNFSGGMDLSVFSSLMDLMKGEPARGAWALRQRVLHYQETFNALERSRLPVIAAIQRACIGGAIDMITACDIRLATEDAYFSIEEINIGMTADVGTLQRLPKLIPMGVVQELALTGRRFSAEEAHGWGLVASLHADAESVREAALATAQNIAEKSPLAVTGTKHALTFARDHAVSEGLEQIATWNGGMLRPEDLMSAMQAKMAKKQAEFKDLIAA
ncbi:MAG: crotonase/enoyl-CoA hydratase family protein [Pseudomonadota bacterium]